QAAAAVDAGIRDPMRHHTNAAHLTGAFGGDGFGRKAEAFARFFGTPKFILIQTGIVAFWIIANALAVLHADPYPFILLNLGFSLQAAYAAPLILLAQTRQADRDKAHAEADAQHREELANESQKREADMHHLLSVNTDLTQQVAELSRKINEL